MRAPATNITDRLVTESTATIRGGQHLPEISDDLKQRVAWRNHDLLEKAAERLSRCIALLIVFQARRERHHILAEHRRHVGVQRRRTRFNPERRQSRN